MQGPSLSVGRLPSQVASSIDLVSALLCDDAGSPRVRTCQLWDTSKSSRQWDYAAVVVFLSLVLLLELVNIQRISQSLSDVVFISVAHHRAVRIGKLGRDVVKTLIIR